MGAASPQHLQSPTETELGAQPAARGEKTRIKRFFWAFLQSHLPLIVAQRYQIKQSEPREEGGGGRGSGEEHIPLTFQQAAQRRQPQ